MITRQNPTRVDKTGELMTERLVVDGPIDVTLLEVLAELESLGATDVRVKAGMFSWVRPATDEEKQDWANAQLEHEARTEKWEREMLVRLKEKYES